MQIPVQLLTLLGTSAMLALRINKEATDRKMPVVFYQPGDDMPDGMVEVDLYVKKLYYDPAYRFEGFGLVFKNFQLKLQFWVKHLPSGDSFRMVA